MSEGDVGAFLACFARAAALLSAAPLGGDRAIPPRFRVALAALCALGVLPVKGPLGTGELWLVLPAELLLGLFAGFLARLVLAGAEAGGQLIGLQLGLGFAGTFDPSAGDEALPTRRLAFSMAGLAFLGAGGLEALVRVLGARTLDGRNLHALLGSVLQRSAEVLPLALRLVAPVLLAALIANLALALASRAAPSLNVFSIMLALVLALGTVVLAATAPAFVREALAIGRLAASAPLSAVAP
jgi:flagellar biosynthetic protein FliR